MSLVGVSEYWWVGVVVGGSWVVMVTTRTVCEWDVTHTRGRGTCQIVTGGLLWEWVPWDGGVGDSRLWWRTVWG